MCDLICITMVNSKIKLSLFNAFKRIRVQKQYKTVKYYECLNRLKILFKNRVIHQVKADLLLLHIVKVNKGFLIFSRQGDF